MDDQSTIGDEEDDADETETVSGKQKISLIIEKSWKIFQIPMSESDYTDRYDATMDVDEEKKL